MKYAVATHYSPSSKFILCASTILVLLFGSLAHAGVIGPTSGPSGPPSGPGGPPPGQGGRPSGPGEPREPCPTGPTAVGPPVGQPTGGKLVHCFLLQVTRGCD